MRTFRNDSDERLLDICEEFLASDGEEETRRSKRKRLQLKHRTTGNIAEAVNARWRARDVAMKITREEVYAAILEARRRDLFGITPPTHLALQQRLCDRFDPQHRRMRVVATESPLPEHVATGAAKLLLDLVREVGSFKGNVHIGFGAGLTTHIVAYQFSLLLSSAPDVPPLTLHATSSGLGVTEPFTAPVCFFGFFERAARDVQYVGMFGPAFVSTNQYMSTRERRGVTEAFDKSSQIDIVVSSLASAHDEHSGLRRLAEDGGFLPKLERRNYVGDVQHLAFSHEAPIDGFGYRAVTLFELDELVELAAAPGKHVLLVSPRCPATGCAQTRAPALRPLLTAPDLKVWTHVVTDILTARDLVGDS